MRQWVSTLGNFYGCREAGNTYKNATISVDMKIISGPSGGLFFRLNTDNNTNYTGGYLFEVDSHGIYKISTVTDGYTATLPSYDWAPTSALKRGYNVTNTLQVVIQGTTFLFYANGTFLTQATDATFTSAGNIALLATRTGMKADIVYSNLKVYT